jgi:hypothetical protein
MEILYGDPQNLQNNQHHKSQEKTQKIADKS